MSQLSCDGGSEVEQPGLGQRHLAVMAGVRMNSVTYVAGTAPVGEVREASHRYGHRRPVSHQAKLVMMRKCKR